MSLVTAALASAVNLAGLPRTMAIYGTAVAAVVARRVAARIAQYMAIAALLAIGASFLTAAAFLALMNSLGAIYAALIVGGAYLVCGLIALLVVRSGRS